MKNTDKVTLTIGQLKKLVKESKQLNESSRGLRDKEIDLYNTICELVDFYLIDKFPNSYGMSETFEDMPKYQKNAVTKYLNKLIAKTINDVFEQGSYSL